MMKPLRAYAVVNNTKIGGIALFDYRVPIFWKKKLAKEVADDYGPGYRVEPVEIRTPE